MTIIVQPIPTQLSLSSTKFGGYTMPDEKQQPEPEWVTLSEAAAMDGVPVTSKTLREMIKRGDVPEGRWRAEPFWNTDAQYYYIDKHILPHLKYRKHGQRGKGKTNKP